MRQKLAQKNTRGGLWPLSWLRQVFLLPVRLYQRWLSPLLPPVCRYYPTCSEYMVEAVEKRGIVIGALKTLWRLCRCQPLSQGGWDPVDPSEPPPWSRPS